MRIEVLSANNDRGFNESMEAPAAGSRHLLLYQVSDKNPPR